MNIESYTLLDGTLIELTMSGRCAGPGEGGQHYGTSYLYYRVDGGEWKHSTHRCFRHLYQAHEWLKLCENKQDFLEIEE